MIRPIRLLAAALLLVGITALPAHAQITVHHTLESWLAAVSGAGLDTFDDLDPEEGFYPSPLDRSAGVYSYSVSSPSGLFPAGIPGVPGERDTWLASFFENDDLLLSDFASGPLGVAGDFFLSGFFGDLASDGTFSLTVTSGADTWTDVFDVTKVASPFLGFTAAAGITSISLRSEDTLLNELTYATINNIRIGALRTATVPEPASLALILSGLVALGVVARRRRLHPSRSR